MLLTGDFENGWKEYEWRWQADDTPARLIPKPQWDGRRLNSATILLHAEQGFGDTFQFVRYAALVKQLGGHVLFDCPRRLTNILASCPGIDQLICEGDPLPHFDVHAPLLSVPGLVHTRLETIPANVPYLFADKSRVEVWREKLQAIQGFRIAINWQGRAGKGTYRKRDVPLGCFARLQELPGVRLISLQQGIRHEDGREMLTPAGLFDPGADFDTVHGAFVDTAAIMKNVDLVISSDTSIPHLAGALGVPIWVALPSVADWRWLLDRRDSPWYPTMKLFRQQHPGDWDAVFSEIMSELSNRLSARR
jgi:hypothetical protein